MAQPVNIQGLLTSYQMLSNANALVAARERRKEAERKRRAGSQLRMLGTVAGAAVGAYYGGGNPYAVAAGAQAGNTIGGMVSAQQGNEDYPSEEVAQSANTIGDYSARKKREYAVNKKHEAEKEYATTETGDFVASLDQYKVQGLTEEEKSQKYEELKTKRQEIDQKYPESEIKTVENLEDSEKERILAAEEARKNALAEIEAQENSIKQAKVLTPEDQQYNSLLAKAQENALKQLELAKNTGNYSSAAEKLKLARTNLALLSRTLHNTSPDNRLSTLQVANQTPLTIKPVNYSKTIGYDPTAYRQKYAVLELKDDQGYTYVPGALALPQSEANMIAASDINKVAVPATQARIYVTTSQKRAQKVLEQQKKEEAIQSIINTNSDEGLYTASERAGVMLNNSAYRPESAIRAISARVKPEEVEKKIRLLDYNKQFTKKVINAGEAIENPDKLFEIKEKYRKQALAAKAFDDEWYRLGGNDFYLAPPKVTIGDFESNKQAEDSAGKRIDQARVNDVKRLLIADKKQNGKYTLASIEAGEKILADATSKRANAMKKHLEKIKKQIETKRNALSQTKNGKIKLTTTLRKEYAKRADKYKQIRQMLNNVRTAVDNGEFNSGIADRYLVYAGALMGDPGSTVREGEAAAMQAAPGMSDRMKVLVRKAKKMFAGELPKGSLFTQEARERYKDHVEEMWRRSYKPEAESIARQYYDLATGYKIKPEEIIDSRDMTDYELDERRKGEMLQDIVDVTETKKR